MSNRLKFFVIHLITSAVLILIFVVFFIYTWYPFPLLKAVGASHLMFLVLLVDLCLGPFLTWVVFNEKKKSLKFDLTIIILIQFFALIYGVYTFEKGRPVWIVFHGDRFELIKKNDVIINNTQLIKSQYSNVGWWKPEYVAVKPSSDFIQQQKDIFFEVLGGNSLAQMPERYQPLANMQYELKRHSETLDLLTQFNPKHNVENILEKYPYANAWLPLKASAVDMVVLINKEKAEVVKIVDLRPWN